MKPQVEQDLAHLLLTELLAYQFASPVRWIETQDVIFGEKRSERIVEVGPSATLAGMATRTLAQNYKAFDAALSLERQILCYAKDTKEIYYQHDPSEDAEPESAAGGSEASGSAAAAAAPAPAALAAATPAAPAPSAAVAEIDDKPLTPLQVLHALIAIKLRKTLDQIPVSKAIKDLVGGKSTVQNEILGDLAKEFNATPEKAEEVPIDELASQFTDGFSGKLGKHTTGMVNKFASAKMPGGFGISNVRKYLQTRWGLPTNRQDAVLLVALTREPAARLGSEGEAKALLDEITQDYGRSQGIDFAAAAAAASSGGAGGAGGAAVSAEALEEITKDQKYLARQQLELLARYLAVDLRDGDKKLSAQVQASELLQKQLDLWLSEHGEVYADGIVPIFSNSKARIYDSSWNWARQDCLRMFYDIIWGRLDSVDRETLQRCIAILNRSSPNLIDMMVYYIDTVPTERGETFSLARDLAKQLMDNCTEFLGNEPLYKDINIPTGPKTVVDAKGNINYSEEVRPNCRKLEQYVMDMALGNENSRDVQSVFLNDSLAKLEQLYSGMEAGDDVTAAYNLLKSRLEAKEQGQQLYKGMRNDIIPFLHLKSLKNEQWSYDKGLTSEFLQVLESCARDGLTFAGKSVLLTGAGKGSIGEKVLEGLLSGGAKVIVTTSRYSKETCDHYQSIYTRYGSTGSTLVVVPFNQASKTDTKALVDYIYSGIGWDLDFIIPFAAIPEGGVEIDGIDSKSELAHRLMLTNLLRLLGEVKTHKQTQKIETRPAQVILPLSPNHGTFGGDGLYSESKISLETLFNRWSSESWGGYLTICGAIIGWTRGTGLMSQNNLVAAGIESLGIRTFSQQEMAFNLLGLLSPRIVNMCQGSPVWADLNGGMQYIPELKAHMTNLRTELFSQAEIRRAVALETGIEHKVVSGPEADTGYSDVKVQQRANAKFEFPELPKYEDLPSKKLKDLVDLDRVAVVTGFSEVGPWGSARTRWEMEAHGEFSIEGAIEMAWIMGLITYFTGTLKNKPYSGWVDAATKAPIEERDIKTKYEKTILEHSGIRLVEPEILDYDPSRKQFLQEVIIEHDLEPFEASKEAAEQFKLEQGDNVEAFPIPEEDMWTVRFLKGARILIPKALQYNRLVAGQIPKGWDARRYGVPDDIVDQVDQITLFALVSTVEALLCSGVTDPYEFYQYVHVSEVGNASGSGMGGMTALRKMFKDRYLEKQAQNDILQESFINTMSAWVNMLLISSSGPIKTPVGACATSVESVDTGLELIRSGAARIVIVGGYDDIKEEGIYEFGNMNATSNSQTEMENGRTPREMSRPTTTSRAGFMEAHGAGIQILMSGDLAIQMGVPVYGIVALTATATDKIGRSVPAPGKGIMTVAREKPTASGPSKYPLLNIDYRRRQLESRRRQIKDWYECEHEYLCSERGEITEQEFSERLEVLDNDARRQEKEAMNTWGNEFYKKDPHIAPLRGALAQWDLTVDDIGISSFHGTSTAANDKNESAAIHDMLVHLGRTKGNPVMGIFQKYLTGHPKGAAGAWMMNGVIQSMNSGIVPGNRNADNIDQSLKDFDRIVFPSISLKTYGIKAGTLTSFGFGQKGAFALIVHPNYLFSVLDKSSYETYKQKVSSRYDKVYRYLHESMCHNNMFRAKDKAPYTSEQESKVYMDPTARVNSEFKYTDLDKVKAGTMVEAASLVSKVSQSESVGVDVELISAINIENETFIERNFTKQEQQYCQASPDPRASYAGTWSAKEAVFKALKTESKGAGASLLDIEVVRTKTGPEVVLHGDAEKVAGDKTIKLSISHNDMQAIAVAVCQT